MNYSRVEQSHKAEQVTEQKQVLSKLLTLIFAIASGLAVSTIYFAQPLLETIADEFNLAHSSMGMIITITQVCYAVGLFLLVPLGDLLNRRQLAIGMMLLSMFGLLTVALAQSSLMMLAGMAMTGLFAVVVQVFVAYAAVLASPSERGRVLGMVTSGIVLGILLARTFAGILTDLAGWRSVYGVAAGSMLLAAFILFRLLPRNHVHAGARLSYLKLLQSVIQLFIEVRVLRIRAVLAFLIFMAFSVLWTSLVLPLSAPPYELSHTLIGAFGLTGVAGALAAARAGRWADSGFGQRTTGISLSILFGSWLPIAFTERSLWALIVGVIALDFAVQAVHVTSQSMILSVRPESRSRLTAGYMIFYSAGSATGSIAATALYAHGGWIAVCLLGSSISGFALLFWFFTKKF
ncbi:MFS transporter [Paenibacillus sinopodophylli]|uniref:MFS transporter n=1 Tax=Paenibacillus sinopodophylli TaxID=1837342 RepID=UPI003CCC7D20